MSERDPASISVGLLLTHSRTHRLLLTRHGVKDGESDTFGLIAGGLMNGENPLKGLLRETSEESGINPENIIISRANIMNPHVAVISKPDKHRVGLIYEAIYSGPKSSKLDKVIENDEKVDMVRWFSCQMILSLLDEPERIYRPEFNQPQLMRWIEKQRYRSAGLENKINDWFKSKHGLIDGICLDSAFSAVEGRSNYEYSPPYYDWINSDMPKIRHDKTSLV